MAPKLPNHLASLLRHQPASVASTDAEETGKTARKKAARIKRRAKAKEDRAAEREEKLRRLQEKRQKAETKVDPPKDEAPKKKKKKLLPKKKKLTAATPKAREGIKVPLLSIFITRYYFFPFGNETGVLLRLIFFKMVLWRLSGTQRRIKGISLQSL